VNRVFIYGEGQTEESFIKRLIAPHLERRGIPVKVILANHKVVKDGPNFKGGCPKYTKAKKEILALLGDTSVKMVTTMLD